MVEEDAPPPSKPKRRGVLFYLKLAAVSTIAGGAGAAGAVLALTGDPSRALFMAAVMAPVLFVVAAMNPNVKL